LARDRRAGAIDLARPAMLIDRRLDRRSVQQSWKGIGKYGAIGLEFTLSVLLGLLGGYWLDGKLKTHGVLTVVGAVIGLAAGYRTLWQVLKQANREADEDERKQEQSRKDFNDRNDRRN
jgi:ATP synthase protein I